MKSSMSIVYKHEAENGEFGVRRAAWNPPLPTPWRGVIYIVWLGRVGVSWIRERTAQGRPA